MEEYEEWKYENYFGKIGGLKKEIPEECQKDYKFDLGEYLRRVNSRLVLTETDSIDEEKFPSSSYGKSRG